MKPFSYVSAATAESAVTLARANGQFIAGGADLLGELKEGLTEPATLVNIKSIPGTADIAPGRDRWSIGANVKLVALAEHAELARVFRAVAMAAADVGSPQMRNVATLGGNLAQHSRCWYYRHRDVPCMKKGGARCFARGGENKYHSLFSGGRCVSPCVSNLAIALTALNASVVVQRGRRRETRPIAQLYDRAWSSARSHHSLGEGDLILSVEIPVVTNQRSVYLQLSEKGDFDWALVSCAASAVVEGKKLRGVRIALGSVAPIPWRVADADAILDGKELSEEVIAKATSRLLRDATPLEQNGYKVPLAQALVKRALQQLVA